MMWKCYEDNRPHNGGREPNRMEKKSCIKSESLLLWKKYDWERKRKRIFFNFIGFWGLC